VRTLKKTFIAFSGLFLVTLVVASSGHTQLLDRVHGIVAGSGINYIHLYLGTQRGIFRDEGLDLVLAYVRGTLVGPAIVSGGGDYILSMTPEAMIFGAKVGTPIKIIMGVTTSPNWDLYAHPSVKTIQELKGKILQTGSVGGTQYQLVRMALMQLGLSNPEKEITFVAGGPSSQRILALQSGAAQAAVLALPGNFAAEAMGFRKLVSLGEIVPLPSGAVLASETKLKSQPDQVRRMIRATIRSLRYMLTHRDEAIARLAKDLRNDRELAAKAYDAFVPSVARDGMLTDRHLQLLLQLHGATDLQTSQIADFSFLKSVMREESR